MSAFYFTIWLWKMTLWSLLGYCQFSYTCLVTMSKYYECSQNIHLILTKTWKWYPLCFLMNYIQMLVEDLKWNQGAEYFVSLQVSPFLKLSRLTFQERSTIPLFRTTSSFGWGLGSGSNLRTFFSAVGT